MAPKAVRDVHPETFIKAYAAHLKANDKVGLSFIPVTSKSGYTSCARSVSKIVGANQTEI